MRLNMIRQIFSLGAIALISCIVLSGQDTLASYTFENDSADWEADIPALWSVNQDRAASGSRSMGYKVAEDDVFEPSTLQSIETGYTIMQVRVMKNAGETLLVGTSYEGTVVCFGYDGRKRWENKLSGYMNHDICCADIDGDGKDEVLAANADGSLYCMDDDGRNLWKFRKNEAPMNTVCMVSTGSMSYIACGGFDKYVYYLSVDGRQMKSFHSTSYSIDKQGGVYDHSMNFMRRIRLEGKDVLVIHSALNTNWMQGSLYFFHPGEISPFKKIKVGSNNSTVYGSFAVNDLPEDSTEIILGGNGLNSLGIAAVTVETENDRKLDMKIGSGDLGKAGYRMASTEVIPHGKSFLYFVHYGNRIYLVSPDPGVTSSEIIIGKFAFNGLCKDKENNRIILASAQSGGSCMHVIDYSDDAWKDEFRELVPPGKITRILDNTSEFRKKVMSFSKPVWERDPVDLYVLVGGASDALQSELAALSPNCPKFITTPRIYPHCEDWDRSEVENEVYREKRDERKKYDYSAEQVISTLSSSFNSGDHGIEFWAGHGSDPMYYSLPTLKQSMDNSGGKVMIPVMAELESHNDDFHWFMDYYMYPLAEYLGPRNGMISLRNKHMFWQCGVYTPSWSRLIKGEFPGAFVSSMEESNSKTMDMSVSGRMGLWTSGAMDRWGTRFTRDNPCYDRLRQISYQQLPNHALRMFVYNIASGASVVHNTNVNEEYSNVLWYMLAKGILFVPKKEEIVSFNPVHLSMLEPDPLYVESNGVKITTVYDEAQEKANPMVFSHTTGAWPGAPVTDWDFSKYATGGNERRMEFLPPYPNGMVLITPPTDGDSLRGTFTDHLHPIYSDMMQEIYTDGRNYYSDVDKSTSYAADDYGPIITQAVKDGGSQLPLTVEGRVAWVTAQTDSLHLRLTLVDGGYVNPDDRKVTVNFHTARVKKITDLLSGESITIMDKQAIVQVPCGLFTFLDIELEEELEY